MKRFIKTSASLVLAFTLTFTNVFATTNTERINEIMRSSEEMKNFEYLIGIAGIDYYFDNQDSDYLRGALAKILKDHPELFEDALEGAFSALDPNSQYIKSSDFASTMEEVDGSYVGIGTTITVDLGKFFVTPFPDSPAEEAGLQTADIITSVDGVSVDGISLDELVSRVRGKAGTYVELGIKRGEGTFTVKCERREIHVSPISYDYLEDGIGYLQITSFNGNIEEYLLPALDDLEKQGAKKIILDLRGNLGGEVKGALVTASQFVPNKALIMTQDFKNDSKNRAFYSSSDKVRFKPIVLIDEYSASASEIVAGAIKDNKAGVLVGQKSYGKGTVQGVKQVFTGGALWYTVASYRLPSGEWIHGKGITPDYVVENSVSPLDISGIPTLSYQVLKKGDTGDKVAALNASLNALGFKNVNDKGIFDDATESAVTYVQSSKELFPYGVADINTQIAIATMLEEAEVVNDDQLAKALEIARNIK
ncbi:MAG: S41 family peptidase [Eubacteriales bacterium]|nr:S41 family peptidase [Eubacteriales bacterium]